MEVIVTVSDLSWGPQGVGERAGLWADGVSGEKHWPRTFKACRHRVTDPASLTNPQHETCTRLGASQHRTLEDEERRNTIKGNWRKHVIFLRARVRRTPPSTREAAVGGRGRRVTSSQSANSATWHSPGETARTLPEEDDELERINVKTLLTKIQYWSRENASHRPGRDTCNTCIRQLVWTGRKKKKERNLQTSEKNTVSCKWRENTHLNRHFTKETPKLAKVWKAFSMAAHQGRHWEQRVTPAHPNRAAEVTAGQTQASAGTNQRLLYLLGGV